MLSSLLLAAAVAGQCSQGRCPAPARYNYAPAAVAAPAVYSLADASGRVWTHADYAYLQSYVARVNASMAPAADPAPAPVATPSGRPRVVVPPSPYVKPAVPVVSSAGYPAEGVKGCGCPAHITREDVRAIVAELASPCACGKVVSASPPAAFRFE